MANYEGTITDFAAGDDITVERTITQIPAGQLLSQAWLTIKRAFTDSDVQAVIRKSITSVITSGAGQINNTGATGSGTLFFYVLAAETALLTPYSEYHYDIQLKLSGGAITTPELGVIVAFPQVTLSTS